MGSNDGYKVLIVDDETAARDVIGRALHRVGYTDTAKADGLATARAAIASDGPFALVMLDLMLAGEDGIALLEELAPRAPQTVVIVVTALDAWATAVGCLKKGAYDFLVKPVDVELVQLAAGRALKGRQRALDEIERRHDLDRTVSQRISRLERTRSGLLRAMCRMAEFRDPEEHAHLERVAMYSHVIAQELAADSPYAPFVTEEFLWNLFEAAPLHDIGKVAIPDGVLLKPGELTPQETAIIQMHPAAGRDICLAARSGTEEDEDDLLKMAAEVTGAHHDRWDGHGYPGGLKGTHIPLSARIVSMADFYDVCRTPTVYRPEPLQREKVLGLTEALAGEKFDPVVAGAFARCKQVVMGIEEG